ncbi:MAG: GH32 C-terminal domain-containing protein [Clostridiales bacterium]|nr:GH32 C-terminal domain-containing protein [Clostridiales bacterium]
MRERFSVEVLVNDGEQALTAAIFTPLSADGISFEVDGRAELEVEKYELRS